MAKNKSHRFPTVVFSTDPDFRPAESEEGETPGAMAPEKQQLRIWLERGRGGKEATIVKGFIGPSADLEELARWLKNTCATGGSAKEGIIILQGNHRDRVMALLQERGYRNTKKAGG